MNILKKCLVSFNNQFTNKITDMEVDDDLQLRFTLLDMQKFAEKYYNEKLLIVSDTFKSDIDLKISELKKDLKKLKKNVEYSFTNSEDWKKDQHLINGKIEVLKEFLK